ncbi:MAG: hypothetical protein AABX66_02625 [Nanoarchaeota archaeon]
MTQNKNKIIELFISNLSNAIVHYILEKAIDFEGLAEKYRKELINSFEIAKAYRNKINPTDKPLLTDLTIIKEKLEKRVNNELKLRISRGYKNINLSLVKPEIERVLKELHVT